MAGLKVPPRKGKLVKEVDMGDVAHSAAHSQQGAREASFQKTR